MNNRFPLILFVCFLALVQLGCSRLCTSQQNQAPLSGLSATTSGPEAVSPPPATQKNYAVRMFMLEPVYFGVGKYSISPRAAKILQKEAKWLKQNPGTKITIFGHADNRSTKKYNRILAQKRADAVKNRLVALGVTRDRIQTISYGAEKPVCTKSTQNCYATNRRVDLQATDQMTFG